MTLCAWFNLHKRHTKRRMICSEARGITSEERREMRYRRRRSARERKKEERCAESDCFDSAMSYGHLWKSVRLSRRGVNWKGPVQRYIAKAPLYVYRTFWELQNERFRSNGFFEFDIIERGKKRHIRSVSFYERVVQRCLCDWALVPVLRRTFVYDNGASLKGKGYSFAIRRLCCHLRDHYRKYGQEGYILLFDFSKFFDNISHETVKQILRREFSDQKIRKLTEYFLMAFGDTGLGLGSQISQVLALASANRLDHYVKEVLKIQGYGRYMDDGYLIHPDKAYLQKCLEEIGNICSELGIRLNKKKTQIVKLSHGFPYLKTRFYLTESGKVVRKLARSNITRTRKKLKKLQHMVDAGMIGEEDVYMAFQSWRAHARQFHAFRTIRSMEKLCGELGFSWEKFEKNHSAGGERHGWQLHFPSGTRGIPEEHD